jgi:hypothetical protein
MDFYLTASPSPFPCIEITWILALAAESIMQQKYRDLLSHLGTYNVGGKISEKYGFHQHLFPAQYNSLKH